MMKVMATLLLRQVLSPAELLSCVKAASVWSHGKMTLLIASKGIMPCCTAGPIHHWKKASGGYSVTVQFWWIWTSQFSNHKIFIPTQGTWCSFCSAPVYPIIWSWILCLCLILCWFSSCCTALLISHIWEFYFWAINIHVQLCPLRL